MNRELLIHTLTLRDTSIYRNISFLNTGTYKHEPSMYRNNLYKIYDKLDTDTLNRLLKLKPKKNTKQ